MYDDLFRRKLIEIRQEKGLSARNLSLQLGKSTNYIKDIESGKSLPTMRMFFELCECLETEPIQFFEEDTSYKNEALYHIITTLPPKKADIVTNLAKELESI